MRKQSDCLGQYSSTAVQWVVGGNVRVRTHKTGWTPKQAREKYHCRLLKTSFYFEFSRNLRKKITRCILSLPDFSDENEDSTDSFLQVEDGNSWKFIFLRIVATLYESSSFIKIMNCMM